MLAEQIQALASLPLRPRRAMSALLDGGGILPGLLLAVVASTALWYGILSGLATAAVAPAPLVASPAAGTEDGGPEQPLPRPGWALLMIVSAFGPIATVAGLVFLYVPATLLLVTLFDRVGSFGVALRRDFAGLLVLTLSAFTVAFLPVGLVGILGSHTPPVLFALLAAGALAFAALMVVALETACGANPGPALATVALSWLSFGLQGFLLFLASPWILFFGYRAMQGQALDVVGGLGARRSFRRYLEASTLNPRDADAHYQLGLIHLQRRQVREAAERFRRAIEIDPGEVDAQLQLARIARREGRWEDSIRHLEAVLARDPQHASFEAWREAGAVYLSTGAFAHARSVLERFVENRPYDAEGLYRLGATHQGLGDGARARELFERCVEAARTAPDHRQREVRPWRREAERELRGLRTNA
jgi:Tfp pilus assembly protein PilF